MTRILRLARRLLLAMLLLALLLQASFALRLWVYQQHPPEHTAFMRAAVQRLATEHGAPVTLDYRWVPLEQIAPPLQRAVLAAEDSRFFEHGGIDWEGLRHAWERNRDAGAPVAGGSTLTQQLAKNLFLSGSRSYLRKGQEAAIALMAEVILGKHRILEMYLNVAEWGDGLYGAEAAAQHYFNVSAAELSPLQAAELAARLPRPRYYAEHGVTPWLARYRQIILARMDQIALPPRAAP